MGRKTDALLRRGFRASKFKVLAKLSMSRLAILRNQRQARCSTARSDVIQLLNLGQHDRAKQRVELVIKEQNMLDVFSMMEDFISLLTERVALLQDNKECPDELEEAISSLIFAATRCGEFPELKHIRETFTSRFGKDFAARAAELRNNCKVNPKIIQKLSTRQATSETRLKKLKEIASENGITLDLEEEAPATATILEDVKPDKKQTKVYKPEAGDEINNLAEMLSESIKGRKFKGVAAAAQEAFEAAAYAAAAAKAAVDLAQADSHDTDSDTDDHSKYEDRQLVLYEPYVTPEEINNSGDVLSSDKIVQNENSSSDKEEVEVETYYSFKVTGESIEKAMIERKLSVSSTDSKETKMAPNVASETEQSNDDLDLCESGIGAAEDQKSVEELEQHDLATNELQHTEQNKDSDADHDHDDNDDDDDDDGDGDNDLKSQVESKDHPMERKSQSFSDIGEKSGAECSGINRKLLSVRTIPVLRG